MAGIRQQVKIAGVMSGPSKSPESTNWANDDWGANDPGVVVEGVHMMVFGGRPVWPLALYQLMTAHDQMAYLEWCMGQADFVILPLEPCLVGHGSSMM